MKNILFLLFTLITIPTFSQDAGNRGTLKVKKVVTDTGCVASVLGYTGKNFITLNELLKIKKVDLNENCDCEIINVVISFISDKSTAKYILPDNTNTFELKDIMKGETGITFVKFKVVAKSKNSGKEIKLPPIFFNIINEK